MLFDFIDSYFPKIGICLFLRQTHALKYPCLEVVSRTKYCINSVLHKDTRFQDMLLKMLYHPFIPVFIYLFGHVQPSLTVLPLPFRYIFCLFIPLFILYLRLPNLYLHLAHPSCSNCHFCILVFSHLFSFFSDFGGNMPLIKEWSKDFLQVP